MLDGEDCIDVSGNTITGLKAGTATVTLRVDSQMNDKTYDLYTAPVTITVDGEPSEHMLTVTFPNTVELSIGGESQTIANLIGTYKDVVMADDALELTFTPSVEGREIAGVTVNSEAIAEDSFDAAEYVYSAAMPNADTTIELGFTVVDKQNLRAAMKLQRAGRTKLRKQWNPYRRSMKQPCRRRRTSKPRRLQRRTRSTPHGAT